jgi:hypothetical protein
MKTLYDLYVDGKLLTTLSAAQAVHQRKRLGQSKGIEFRIRFERNAKPSSSNGGRANA